MTTGFVDQPRLAGLMLKEALRRLVGAARSLSSLQGLLERRPDMALLVAPLDLRRGDPAVARAFYSGLVRLGGVTIETGGASPFTLRDAPRPWQGELNSFDWLRHFTEAGDALSSEHARVLTADWMAMRRSALPGIAFDHDITARRAIAWLTHSPIILAQADATFAQRFLRRLDGELRRLRRRAADAPDGLPRLRVRMAIAFGALCRPTSALHVKSAAQHLGHELERQIYPDGGHISRNPAAIPTILRDLLRLRHFFAVRGHALPRSVFGAVDRMLPALRFFQHSDGTLALFNGAGHTDPALIATLLRYDETLGDPSSQMRQSGYHRMSQGTSVILADAGLPPAPEVSGDAHAGTLAFELSAGGKRLVVNCGSPLRLDTEERRLSRTTAAHSTLTLADHSSSRFAKSQALDRFLGAPLMPGPTRVPTNREDASGGQILTVAHDGYRHGFGLVHERQIALSHSGRRVDGVDRLIHAAGRSHRTAQDEPMGAIRFHLHPDVQAEEAGQGIRLACGAEVWWFFAGAEAVLEDSIFFADADGASRLSRQIVIGFDSLEQQEIAWRFERQR